MTKLVRSTTVALLLAGLTLSAQADAGPRKSITALSASELASLRKAVAQMKAWNSAPKGSANYRRSWQYWANMHGYFGPGCGDVINLNKPGMSGLSEQTPTTPDQSQTWCTCEHGTIQFLTWHRMYLYYFEKVLQAAAGDPNLQLPYWNYQSDGHIPPAYRAKLYLKPGVSLPLPNPLYTANRKSNLNDGTAALASITTSSTAAMSQTGFNSFSSLLESTPHGDVHCAVGVAGCGSGYMGSVPAAGNDPIFYTHHAMIDRLYQCWLRINPSTRLPTDPTIINATYSFPDGTGTIVTRKVSDMLTIQQLGYYYTGICPNVLRVGIPDLVANPPFWVTIIGPSRIRGGRPTTIPLRASDQARGTVRQFLARPAGRQPIVRIAGIRANRVPQALYKVSIRDSSGAVRTLGLLNFFNMTSPKAAAHEGHDGALAQSFVLPSADILLRDGQLIFEPTTGVTGRGEAERAARLDADVDISFDQVAVSFQ